MARHSDAGIKDAAVSIYGLLVFSSGGTGLIAKAVVQHDIREGPALVGDERPERTESFHTSLVAASEFVAQAAEKMGVKTESRFWQCEFEQRGLEPLKGLPVKGPSMGLAFALALSKLKLGQICPKVSGNQFEEDLAMVDLAGVAATGEVFGDGMVGNVGNLAQKVRGILAAKLPEINVLVIPKGETDVLPDEHERVTDEDESIHELFYYSNNGQPLLIVPAGTVEDAAHKLATLQARSIYLL